MKNELIGGFALAFWHYQLYSYVFYVWAPDKKRERNKNIWRERNKKLIKLKKIIFSDNIK